MTKRYAVIGQPVGHSRSPAMFNAAFAATGIDASYEAIEVRLDELTEFVERARSGAFAGFNVTTPLKDAIVPLLDSLSDAARAAEAVNAVRLEPGRLAGDNFDGAGLVRALSDTWQWSPHGASVLVLGRGPAARAAAIALKAAGAVHVACWSRNEATARRVGPPPRRPTDLVVSTLPATAVVPDAVLELIGPRTLVFDANYAAARSPVPSAIGRAHSFGLPMLLHQGVLTFEWWTGGSAPLDAMRAAIGR